MTEAATPEAGAPKPGGEAAYPVRPPAVTTTFAVSPQSALSRRLGWLGIAVFIALLFTPGVALADDKYWLPLFTRYMALALFAISLDLVWGYTGLLSLGQGLFFGMGAYVVGYSLKLQKAALEAGLPFVASPDMALPDFMAYCRLEAVPSWIAPLMNIYVALPLAVLLPAVAAGAFGYVTFRRRIKGVYFALITQALVLAAFTFVVNQQPYTGGVVGMNNLAKLELFGQRFTGPALFYLTTAVLTAALLACLGLVRSKFGKILTAIRDSEYRVLALGYDTAAYKTFIFALAGGLAGLAGALYAADLGTTGPDTLGIVFSIQVVVLVAVGGRGTLFGAVIGAVLVSFAETYINDNYNEVFRKYLHGEGWPLIMGGLFVLVVVFLPEGLLGGFYKGIARLKQIASRRPKTAPGGGA